MATLESTAAEPLVQAPAPAGRRPAVEVAHLRKTYGPLVAVDDVSFTVAEGEIFGILGPNGAGKTTAIECAIGLRRPDVGTIRLLGLDPHADQDQVHEIVGVQLQSGVTGLAIVNITSVVAFGAPVPKSAGGLALSCLLAIGGLFALGLLIAALAPTASSVNAIGRLALIPLMFFAGLWLPRAIMPAVLQDISNYTPLGAAVEAIQDSVQTGFPPAAPLLVLAGYTLVFAFLARRFFRWE